MAQWDPRSYLAQAAAEHFLSVDVNATATTSIDYYDAIASHLNAADTHRRIADLVASQRTPVASDDGDRTVAHDGVHLTSSGVDTADAAVCGSQDLVFASGVAFASPFSVAVADCRDRRSDDAPAVVQRIVEGRMSEAGEAFAIDSYASCKPATPSALQRFNTAGVGQRVQVPTAVMDLVRLCQNVSAASTGGRFDPTAAVAGRIWQQVLRTQKRRPNHEDLGGVWDGVGISEAVTVDPDASTLAKARSPATQLDLSSTAKGLVVDKIFEDVCHAFGTRDALVEWGGDLRVAGLHPVQRRPWVIGVPQPPSLNQLYSAWHAGKPLPEPTYRHCFEAPTEGVAVAASGDYRQLFKYGYTHLMDASTREPVRAQAHTVSGAVAVAPTCAEADAAATALVLEDAMEGAISFAVRLRQRCGEPRVAYSLGNCGRVTEESPSTSSAPTTPAWADVGVRLQRYYLFERNHDTFVNDEDDGVVGEGDELRRREADKHMNRDAAVHVVSQEGSALRRSKKQHSAGDEGDDSTHRHGADDGANPVGSMQLRSFMRCRPAQLAVAVVPTSTVISRSDGSTQSFHAVLLSSLVVLGRSHGDTSASSSLTVTFNVMRGSALFNHVVEAGSTIGMHLLTRRDAPHVEAMSANHNRWMSSVTGTSVEVPAAEANGTKRAPVCVVDQLAHCAYTCRILHTCIAGDHLNVVACATHAQPIDHGDDEDSVSTQYLLRCLGRLSSLPPPISGATVPTTACHLVAVLYGVHRSFGKVAVPVRGLTVVSENPPMMSFFALATPVSRAFLKDSDELGERAAIAHEAGCSIGLLGGGADTFVEGRASTAPRSDDVESLPAADRPFAYIPFPSFKEAPGLAATLQCHLLEATEHAAGSAGSGFITFVVRLDAKEDDGFSGGVRPTDFGSQLLALVQAADGSAGGVVDMSRAPTVDLALLAYAGGVHVTQLLAAD